MKIVNATNLRKNLYEHLDKAIKEEPVIITTKNGNAVLISEEEYNSMRETAYLNSIPGMAKSIIEGMNTHRDEFVEIDWENELSD